HGLVRRRERTDHLEASEAEPQPTERGSASRSSPQNPRRVEASEQDRRTDIAAGRRPALRKTRAGKQNFGGMVGHPPPYVGGHVPRVATRAVIIKSTPTRRHFGSRSARASLRRRAPAPETALRASRPPRIFGA